MIYVTGDTHIPIDIKRLSSKNFPEQKDMTEKDSVIICGDFGGVWAADNEERYWLDWLDSKNFTTLFVDGNHENFDLLATYPVEELFGGRVQRISKKVYRLMRGQVFNIDGHKIFAFGGAESHDKAFRKEGISWFAGEMPSGEEMNEARKNLEKVDYSVDYIITHCAPRSVQDEINPTYVQNYLTDFLEEVKNKTSYKKWFFGHYHEDKVIDEKHIAYYNYISDISKV